MMVDHGSDDAANDEKVGESLGFLPVSNEVDSCSLTGVSIIIELLNGDHEDDCDDHIWINLSS